MIVKAVLPAGYAHDRFVRGRGMLTVVSIPLRFLE
jgi:hypothetical protein